MNPFEFVTDLSQSKKDLIRSSDDPETTEKKYTPFMVNKAFSYFPDTIMHSNEMNRAYEMDHLLQHDYYLHAIRSKKRFSKWHKPETDETVKLIADTYNININRAREYMSLLSKEDIDIIKKKNNKGGRE